MMALPPWHQMEDCTMISKVIVIGEILMMEDIISLLKQPIPMRRLNRTKVKHFTIYEITYAVPAKNEPILL